MDDAAPPDFKAFLWERYPDAGKYSAIIMLPDVETIGYYMNPQQLADLADYQRKTGVRSFKFGSDPAAIGFSAAGKCASDNVQMQFTSAAPFGISGVRPTALLSAAGVNRWGPCIYDKSI